MTLAAKYKKEWNKPHGTPITRIPEGIEDAMFRSYFEGFYTNEQPPDYKQDISELANKQLKAASLLMDQLGSNYTVTVYRANDDFKSATKIEDPYEAGKFFRDNCYVIDVKSASHRYNIIWDGFAMPAHTYARVNEYIIQQQLSGGLLESNQSLSRVSACQEGEDFLQFFPKGFVVLNGKYKPMAELDESLKQGAMF